MRLSIIFCAAIASALLVPAAGADVISDAEAVALELSGELLAPPPLVATIDAHLQAIRDVEPVLGVVRCYPPWEPGKLLVMLTAAAWDEYVAGTYTGLDSLNAVYGPVAIVAEYGFMRTIVLDFEAHYNGALLAAIYETAPGVYLADPNWYGFTDTDIWADSLGTYNFRYGWFDCPLGCVYNHFWTYRIDGLGEPVLLDEWGDPLQGVGVPETEQHRVIALAASPNPFSTDTRITASVPVRGSATLNVVDVAGRHVRAITDGSPAAGLRSVRWDGTDDRGRRVPGGVYFVLLGTEDGRRSAVKVVLRR